MSVSKFNPDLWKTDEELATFFHVKKETVMIKVRRFEKECPSYVFNVGKRISYIPAFVEWDSFDRKHKDVSRKPKFEFSEK